MNDSLIDWLMKKYSKVVLLRYREKAAKVTKHIFDELKLDLERQEQPGTDTIVFELDSETYFCNLLEISKLREMIKTLIIK